jgi:nucleoside-diphosphate-sugar epimerase
VTVAPVTRVLVTGATGFIGRHTLEPLVRGGFAVHAVQREADPVPAPGVTPVRLDLHDSAAVDRYLAELRPTHLLHLAWYTEPGAYWTSAENVRWVVASLQLMRSFAAHGGRRAVMAGTCAEYDWSGGVCVEGSTPLVPGTLYGVCKRAVGSVLEAYAPLVNLSAAWGRVFFLYGPHEKPGRLVSGVAAGLLAGRPVPCTEGTQRRDFMHVADAATAFVALLSSAVEGAVNIGSGEAVSVRRLVEDLARLAGRSDLPRLGALPTRPDDPPLVVADVTRLRDEVGWRPRFSLAEGLADTLAFHAAEKRA